MKNRKILALFAIELVILAIISWFTVPKTSLNTRIEAVNMELTNYKFDYYVGTNVVKTGDVGTAKYTFNGVPAFYDLKIGYVDEDDGNCSYTVNVGNAEIANWTADKNPTKDCLFTKTIQDVKLTSNTDIKIFGTRNEGESARLAFAEITYSHGLNLFSLIKYNFSHFSKNLYTANFFILIITLVSFFALNITTFILMKSKKRSDNFIESSEKVEDTSSKSTKSETTRYTTSQPTYDNTQNSSECPDESLIDQMTKYIENNYTDSNFTVQQMADNFDFSLNYISSFFKENTGQNIVFYLTNLRIEKAKALLVSTDMTVKNVAENSGYYNVSSFIRRFKQITGCTPGEYRLSKNA